MHSYRPKNIFSTWWANRWLELGWLYRNRPAFHSRGFDHWGSNQLGYTEARSGRVLEPSIDGGVIRATVVTRNQERFFSPKIEVAPLTDPSWSQALDAFAARAQFLAELLSGRLPAEITALFQGTGVDLFPSLPRELKASCTCRYYEPPCTHAVALHYMVADALERDPLLLFELRGLPREKLLSEAHARRRTLRAPAAPTTLAVPSPVADATLADAPGAATAPASGVDAAGLSLGGYETLPRQLPEAAVPPEVPAELAGPLRALRSPAGWPEDKSPAELLAPVLEAAARQARKLLTHPGVIRSLSPVPASDPRLLQARRLLPGNDADLVLRALECIALARRACRGDDLGAVLEGFSSLLVRPNSRPESWQKTWIEDHLQGELALSCNLEFTVFSGEVTTTSLLALLPRGPVALSWVSQARSASPEARRKAGRALLAGLDELVPGGTRIELVASRQKGDSTLNEYLDILGWDYVLRPGEGQDAEASPPTLLPLQDRSERAAEAFWVPEPGVAPEALVGVSAAQLDRALWLQVLARELLGLLGSAGTTGATARKARTPAENPEARGLQRVDALATMNTTEATRWLRACVALLGARPWLKGVFKKLPGD